jgi:hypothetical protein
MGITIWEHKKFPYGDCLFLKRVCDHMGSNIDTAATCKKIDREHMKRCCMAESIDAAATRKKFNRENMKKLCEAESTDAAATQKSNGNTSKKIKC